MRIEFVSRIAHREQLCETSEFFLLGMIKNLTNGYSTRGRPA
jgi:hypothetical protein